MILKEIFWPLKMFRRARFNQDQLSPRKFDYFGQWLWQSSNIFLIYAGTNITTANHQQPTIKPPALPGQVLFRHTGGVDCWDVTGGHSWLTVNRTKIIQNSTD